MSSTATILSHKMARRQKRRTRKLRQPTSRLELLPVELQLAILENMSSCEDLTLLVASSRTLRAVYDRYKKTILAHVIQATLGDAFIEACMLQHWRRNINTYRRNEPETNFTIPRDLTLDGPYRHGRLEFLHDWCEHATASAEDQIRNMQHLLTVKDLEQIMRFYGTTVKPLSRLFIEEAAPVHDFESLYVVFEPDPNPLAPWYVSVTEWQRIMRTLYRYEICCRVHGPDFDSEDFQSNRYWWIDMPRVHGEMMTRDFFSMFDPSENEVFSFVYTQLASEVHKAFRLIWRNEEWGRAQGDRDLNGYVTSSHGFYLLHSSTGVRRGLGGVTQGTLAMGLGLLSAIRSAATADEVAAILVAKNPPAVRDFMWQTIIDLREAFHFSGGGETAWPESWSDDFWE